MFLAVFLNLTQNEARVGYRLALSFPHGVYTVKDPGIKLVENLEYFASVVALSRQVKKYVLLGPFIHSLAIVYCNQWLNWLYTAHYIYFTDVKVVFQCCVFFTYIYVRMPNTRQ